METKEMAKKGMYLGTGIGLILFILVGMFPGSLIGGAVGLFVSNKIFGVAAGTTLIPRMITALSMVAGILGAAGVFVIGSSMVGWVAGSVLDTLRAAESKPAAEVSHK